MDKFFFIGIFTLILQEEVLATHLQGLKVKGLKMIAEEN